MLETLFLFGNIIRFELRLPNTITRIPAAKNLMPAKRSCEGVSSDAIFNKPYPIFINGNALPHNAQQSIARKHTTAGLHNMYLFLSAIYFVVEPNPPSLTPSASSSTVIPKGVNIPCANPSPEFTTALWPAS